MAGTARQHLHKWIAAASVVQRAVRSWLLRRGLRRFTEQRMRSLNAVVRLQALCRGRAVRRQYMQLRQAAICIQVLICPPSATMLAAPLRAAPLLAVPVCLQRHLFRPAVKPYFFAVGCFALRCLCISARAGCSAGQAVSAVRFQPPFGAPYAGGRAASQEAVGEQQVGPCS